MSSQASGWQGRGGGADFGSVDVAGSPRSLIAVGGTLEPATLVAAYRAGCFPWPSDEPLSAGVRRLVKQGHLPQWPGADPHVPWCSPDPRAVLLTDSVRTSRSLRRTLRASGWETTVDTCFEQVMQACAAVAPGREQTWITDRMQSAYLALHHEGGAHSLEVWDGEQLVGGLYGVLTGLVFSGESMFHLRPDASKVGLVDLCDRLLAEGVRVVDTQQPSAHLAAMGQLLVSRADYLTVLAQLRDGQTRLDHRRLPVSRLGR